MIGCSIRSTTLALAAAILLLLPVSAQTSVDFSTAVQTFNSGQYPQAADLLTQYLRQSPNDALAHYYLGVTWHCLGRAQEAANEYNWVARNSADPELLKRANMGLAVVSRNMSPAQAPGAYGSGYQPAGQQVAYGGGYQPAGQQVAYGAGYQQSAPVAGMGYQQAGQQEYGLRGPMGGAGAGGGGATGWLSARGAKQAAQATGGTGATVTGTQGRIVDLYTQWCGWCKKFEPLFYQTQAKYGNALQFERIDAEAPGNDVLVKKYHVQGYPTILLLDNNGKLRKRIDGAPQSMQEFETTIFAAYPALRPN